MARLRPHVEAMIANTLIKLQVNAKAQSTVKANEYILRHLSKHANLLEPEEECKTVEKGYRLVRAINETTAIYRKRK